MLFDPTLFVPVMIFVFAVLLLGLWSFTRGGLARGLVLAAAMGGLGGKAFGEKGGNRLAQRVMALLSFGGNGDGGKTQTAGTVIQYLVPPDPRGFTRITNFQYILGSTAHTVTFLRPLGKTTVASAGATGQAVCNITADPGVAAAYGGISNAIAANDFVAIKTASDGVTRLYKVSSVATLAITMTANLTVAVAAGDEFWFFGITTDTDGRTGSAHPALLPTVSVTSTYTDREGGVVASIAKNEPILINSSNGTTAGTILGVNWAYSIN